jgi:hypothetical protein
LRVSLADRNNVPLEFKPIAGPPAVIEAVKNGEADIGFVAYEATRARDGQGASPKGTISE